MRGKFFYAKCPGKKSAIVADWFEIDNPCTIEAGLLETHRLTQFDIVFPRLDIVFPRRRNAARSQRLIATLSDAETTITRSPDLQGINKRILAYKEYRI